MRRRGIELIEVLKSRFLDRTEKELRARVLRGQVTVSGEKILKPGTIVAADAAIELHGGPLFVSRGGEKLAAALAAWEIACGGSPWIDAGCSTGGFTDCLLRNGAPLVYAVDVGEGQLDWRLRTDARVKVMERTNVMSLTRADFQPPPGRAVADLSFRSLAGAARHILALTTDGWGIFLAKPQFELRSPTPDFRGVIRDQSAARQILSALVDELAEEGVQLESAVASPITGRKGNHEYLLRLRLARPGGPPARRGAIDELFLE